MIEARCKAHSKIDATMEKVLERIYDNPEKSAAFERLVFMVWANARRETWDLSQLLDQEINAVIEKEFDARPSPQGD